MEQEFLYAITSFGIGGIFRVLGMLILGTVSGIFSRQVFRRDTSLKYGLLYAFLAVLFLGLAYLVGMPFFKHPITDIGIIAMWIIVIPWNVGLWANQFDFD